MKNLVVLALVIVSSVAFAKGHKVTAEAKKAAKEACLTENKDMKGAELKKCIMEKTKATAETANNEATKTEHTEAAKK